MNTIKQPLDILTNELQRKKTIVKKMIVDSIQFACDTHNSIMVCNPINENSFPLIFDGANTKRHDLLLKTESQGLIAGYVLHDVLPPENYTTKPIEISIDNEIYNVIKDNEILKLAPSFMLNKDNEIVHALCDNDFRYITSDLDVLMIIPRNSSEFRDKIVDTSMGDILQYEYSFVKTLNAQFQEALKSIGHLSNEHTLNLIQHGPFNRFNGTKKSHLHFPMKIYIPYQKIRSLGDESKRKDSLEEFTHFLSECRLEGYFPEPHPLWELQGLV